MNFKLSSQAYAALVLLFGQLLNLNFKYQTNAQIHTSTEDEGSSSIFNDTILNLDPILDEHSRCQPLQIPFCDKVDYNKTILPNFLGHHTQSDVESEINIYHPLVKIGCSPDIRLFLCTVYAPICFDHENGAELKLLPCQSLCESARQGCASHLKKLGYDWPQTLQCDRFPDGRRKEVQCVGNDSHTTIDTIDHDKVQHVPRDLGFVCPKNFEVNSYSLHINGKTYNNCAMPCDEVYLDKGSSQVVRLVTGTLTIVCLLSTLFTCVTFALDLKRFRYPARPIIIIAFCQLIVATCYLIGFTTHNRIACNDPTEPPKSLPNMKMIRTTTMGNRKGSCTLLFMALYFFQMSTIFWWLMLTISWYMIAKLKWAPEAVSSVARYFHMFSWTLPALLTVFLAVRGDIEGDPLTGVCHVNSSNQESVMRYIILPATTCLILGVVFLLVGFKSIWDSREILRREYGKQTDEHYKLVLRIVLYSLLFIIFTTLFISCYIYEQSNLNSWKLAWLSNVCKNRHYSIPCPTKDFSNDRPHNSIFLLKYFASMAVGIISAIFMMSRKTITAYMEVVELCNYKLGV